MSYTYYIRAGKDYYPGKNDSSTRSDMVGVIRDILDPFIGYAVLPGEIGITEPYPDIYQDENGVYWRKQEGEIDNSKFERNNMNRYNPRDEIGSLSESLPQGGTLTPKINGGVVSQNVGYYLSSTWKILKERGILRE